MIKSLFKRFADFIYNRDTLEERVFSAMLFGGTIVAVISSIVTMCEHLGLFAALTNILCALAMIVMIYLTYGLKISKNAPLVFVYLLSVVFLPLNFFVCGGIHSGMPLYLLVIVFVIVATLKGPNRPLALAVTFTVDTFIILLSYFMYDETPNISFINNDFLTKLDLRIQVTDVCITIIIVGMFMYTIERMMMHAYEKERENNKKLISQYKALAERDSLTGLYNRAVFCHRIGTTDVFSKGWYVALLNLDDFKSVNDIYSLPFGDKALIRISKEINDFVDERKGEFASRYNGDEFVLLLKCRSGEEAFERLENLRKDIEKLQWDIKPDPVTLSGGIVKCEDFSDINHMMIEARRKLTTSKKTGKNKTTIESV